MLMFSHMAGVAAKNCVHFLLNALQRRGYTCIGPTVRDAAIVYEKIRSEHDLPIGYTDEQDGGTYRLKKRNDEARFGYTVGHNCLNCFVSKALANRSASVTGLPGPFQ